MWIDDDGGLHGILPDRVEQEAAIRLLDSPRWEWFEGEKVHWRVDHEGVKLSCVPLFEGEGKMEIAYSRGDGWRSVTRCDRWYASVLFEALVFYVRDGGDPADVLDLYWTGNKAEVVTEADLNTLRG